MWDWIITLAIDNVIPIILTVLLGIVGAKLKHVKDALQTITDSLADGMLTKAEWKDIRAKVARIIGR